ncbi:MAG: hypothetical protein ACRC51_08850 [Cetobacterium sp.]
MKLQKYHKFGYLLLFLTTFLKIFSQDINLEELIKLRDQGVLSEEEFKVLQDDLNGKINQGQSMYTLNINGVLVSRTYRTLSRDGKRFFPIKSFFQLIDFTNYTEEKDFLIARLGTSLKEVKIVLNSNDVIRANDDIYLVEDKFDKSFLQTYTSEERTQVLRMYLGFDTPNEIRQLLDITKGNIERKNSENELIFKSQRKLFDLGYTRVQLGQSFTKSAGSRDYDGEWDGNLAYQGGLLYGEVKADYDLKENELNTVRLEYVDIWKNHNLDIQNRRAGSSREWGVSLYKDKGFYESSGGHIIIRESVPIGSRAELLYMGTSIDIQDDVNGIVEFDNPIIRTDRTYTLKIYQADGKIIEKTIKTVEDYNLQRKREFEYSLNINERSEYDKFDGNIDVFYGITNNFTLGVGYLRGIEELEDRDKNLKAEYIDSMNLNLVYGNTYNGLSYIFSLNGNQTLNNRTIYRNGEEHSDTSLDKRYTYTGLTQLNYDKWKLIYEHKEFGSYYDEDDGDNLKLTYKIFKNAEIGYKYDVTRYRDDQKKDRVNEAITLDTDYTWNKILFSAGADFDTKDSDSNQYRVSMYYSGWEKVNARLENTWTNNGEEYETRLSLYNNNFKGMFDFSTELAYSNADREMVTFKLSMKLDDWLKFDNTLSSDGARNHRVGIDKVIDLKKPTHNLDTMDSSRVKVVTFIDSNNNDVYDENEELVPGVEVKIGNDTIVTNEKGSGYFYGVANGNIHDLKVMIKKPSFTLGNNKIKVKSDFASTIEAYIPVKPMLTLSGHVNIDNSLKLTAKEKIELYNDLIIELKNTQGETIEVSAPDNTGMFDISGLFPKDYYIEVTYVGTRYDLRNIREEIVLGYSNEGTNNTLLLRISNNNMKIDLPKDSDVVARLY